jgi:hypothetical protein
MWLQNYCLTLSQELYNVNIAFSAVGAVWDGKDINRSVYRILHGHVEEASINIIV